MAAGDDPAMGSGESGHIPLSRGTRYPRRGTPRYTNFCHVSRQEKRLEHREGCGMRAAGRFRRALRLR